MLSAKDSRLLKTLDMAKWFFLIGVTGLIICKSIFLFRTSEIINRLEVVVARNEIKSQAFVAQIKKMNVNTELASLTNLLASGNSDFDTFSQESLVILKAMWRTYNFNTTMLLIVVLVFAGVVYNLLLIIKKLKSQK